jgi:hypothetical protein
MILMGMASDTVGKCCVMIRLCTGVHALIIPCLFLTVSAPFPLEQRVLLGGDGLVVFGDWFAGVGVVEFGWFFRGGWASLMIWALLSLGGLMRLEGHL